MRESGADLDAARAALATALAALEQATSPAAVCGSARSIRRLAQLCGLGAAVTLAERLEAAAGSPHASRLYRERLHDAVHAHAGAPTEAVLASVAIRLG